MFCSHQEQSQRGNGPPQSQDPPRRKFKEKVLSLAHVSGAKTSGLFTKDYCSNRWLSNMSFLSRCHLGLIKISRSCRNSILMTFTTKIWVVGLIGHAENCFNHHKHYPDLRSEHHCCKMCLFFFLRLSVHVLYMYCCVAVVGFVKNVLV